MYGATVVTLRTCYGALQIVVLLLSVLFMLDLTACSKQQTMTHIAEDEH